jgi:hypothetical protein
VRRGSLLFMGKFFGITLVHKVPYFHIYAYTQLGMALHESFRLFQLFLLFCMWMNLLVFASSVILHVWPCHMGCLWLVNSSVGMVENMILLLSMIDTAWSLKFHTTSEVKNKSNPHRLLGFFAQWLLEDLNILLHPLFFKVAGFSFYYSLRFAMNFASPRHFQVFF